MAKSKKRKKRRKKKRHPTKLVFEARPRDEEPPPGFDIKLGEVTQDEAFATIEARLNDARDNLPEGYEGVVIIHPMADGSVDGELYVTVPEGEDTREAEFDLYDSFTATAVGTRYWVSVGARYIVDTDDERYRRNKGMTQVQTNYQRANRANIVEEHLIFRKKIAEGMDQKFGEEAHSIFIRLHWNPQNEQPKR